MGTYGWIIIDPKAIVEELRDEPGLTKLPSRPIMRILELETREAGGVPVPLEDGIGMESNARELSRPG